MAKIEQELPADLLSVSGSKNQSKYVKNRLFNLFAISSALILGLVLLSIIVFIGKTGLLVFKDVSPMEFFFSLKWDPDNAQKFGAGVFIIGTVALTGLTLLLATPISLGLAVFTVEIAPEWLKRLMRPTLDLLVGIPSIVYGYLGLTILIPFIRQVTGSAVGNGLFAAALVLTIMVLPTITRISDDALTAVPRELREASYAQGSTRFQTIFRVMLPAAREGIFTAIILGMARSIGETMAVVMVIGGAAQLPPDLFTSTHVLTSYIVSFIVDVQTGSTYYNALYMMAFLLLVISTLMIVMIRKIRTKGVS
ncbi:phosphate ABC transporter permease subunit PstC [Metabacillus sp. GX 13764]|uniref:phosphate ABC transporter permease subunit PstC n=1 Tax=Metabacillus kandeliae TaxID=2900151 RepID=UPI001E3BE0AC|nr:phosphate ABC transporter permease subunit PstC [Metabacillus kandeliae]MCD7034478.1 phosphate ABC transporter permease subunit PstC [Metabacillus kandeliae]